MVLTNNNNIELNHYYGTTDPTEVHKPGVNPDPKSRTNPTFQIY